MSGVAPPIPYSWSVGDVGSAALLDAQLYTGLTFLLGPPIALYQQSTAQSLGSNTFTTVTWPTPSVDTYGGYSASNPTRYTPQQPGYYAAVGQIGWVPNGTGGRTTTLAKNGAGGGAGFCESSVGNSGASFNSVVQALGAVYFNGTSDYFELISNQNSGSALNSVPAYTSLFVFFVHT